MYDLFKKIKENVCWLETNLHESLKGWSYSYGSNMKIDS